MSWYRVSSFVIACAAFAGVFGQFLLNGAKPGMEAWLPRAWELLRYFTVLTNLIVAGVMFSQITKRPAGANWLTLASLNIAMVGLIYRTVLAPAEPLQGWAWHTDFLMHGFAPVAMVIWWLRYCPHPIRISNLPLWLALPGLYVPYAVIRGMFDGRYPYFFLDLGALGPARLGVNIAGLTCGFALAGFAFWQVSQILARRSA